MRSCKSDMLSPLEGGTNEVRSTRLGKKAVSSHKGAGVGWWKGALPNQSLARVSYTLMYLRNGILTQVLRRK